ncbi:MAG: MATE family efflux transporter [Phycisphaeraceae bacterium]|nr:MATE family efflux transporter [Phycisphaeraceae bacterium]
MAESESPQPDPAEIEESAESAVGEPSVSAGPSAPLELGGRLAGLSIGGQVVVLAIWPLLEQFLGFFVGYVDTWLAAHSSVATANAVAVGAYVGWLIGLVQGSVGIGATAVIARAVGGRRMGEANVALGQAVIVAMLAGLSIGLVIFSIAPLMARFVGLTGESAELCVLYLRIMAMAAPFSSLLFVGAACLRGAGDTRSPFRVLLVVNLTNMLLSWLLVAGPSTIFGWLGGWGLLDQAGWLLAPTMEQLGGLGVLGIAGGTLLAWVIGSVLILRLLVAGSEGMKLARPSLRPVWSQMKRILRVGVPHLIELFLVMWIANFAIVRIVGQLGDPAAWGAHLIAIRIEAISYLPGFALGIASATLVGQYLGLGDPERARRAAVICWRYGAGLMGVMGLMFILVPHWLVNITTNQPEFLARAPDLLRIAGPVQVFFATSIVLGQALRGAGATRTTLFITAVSTYTVRLPLAYLLGVHFELGLAGVWIGLSVELFVRGVLVAIFFHRGRWQDTSV